MGRLSERLAVLTSRYGQNAQTACCGVCKPCVTQAAVGGLVAATGIALEVRGARRADGDDSGGPPAREGAEAGSA